MIRLIKILSLNKMLKTTARGWTPLLCLLAFGWLTGCLKSLDPQLTPVITSVSPDTTTFGATITVRGANFSFLNAATSVAIVLRGADTTLTVDRPTVKTSDGGENEIKLYIPNIASGKYQLFLLVKDREGDRKSNEVPLSILTFGPSSIEPARGPAGTLVTIRGNGLKGTQLLAFPTPRAGEYIEKEPYGVPTDTEVKVVVPEGAVPGSIRMRFKDIAIEAQTPEFRVTLPAPTVTSLAPNQAQAGAKLIITGTNLGLGTVFARKVTFSGRDNKPVTASIVESESNTTQLTVTVPGTAITGPVKVEIDSVLATGTLAFTLEEVKADKQLFWVSETFTGIVAAHIQNKPVTFVTILDNASYYLMDLSVDRAKEQVYFSGYDNNTGEYFIRSIKLDGTGETLVLSKSGMINKVKVADGYVYWQQDNAAIYRANLSDKTEQKIHSGAVYAIDIAPSGSMVYFIQQGDNGFDVKRRNVDGSGQAEQVTNNPYINVDVNNGVLKVSGAYLYVQGFDPNGGYTTISGKTDDPDSFTFKDTNFGQNTILGFTMDATGLLYGNEREVISSTNKKITSRKLDGSALKTLYEDDTFNPEIKFPEGAFDVY